MDNQKLENVLNVSLSVDEEERMKSEELEVGFNPEQRTWELIVKYNGNLKGLEEKYEGLKVRELLNEYAVINIPQNQIDAFSRESKVEYIEKPKRLYFEIANAKAAACVNFVQQGFNNEYRLFGAGTIVAVIDSGINITDRTFRNEDGTTRILDIWDQTTDTEYSREQINNALQEGDQRAREIIRSNDYAGHGSYVAQIACGNEGIAPQSDIIVVKMGVSEQDSFPRTTQLMTAVDYVIRKAEGYQKPIAINISFGNNYGNHLGTSLIETFLDDISSYWKSVICVGSGNESTAAIHMSGIINDDTEQNIELVIGNFETSISVQIWKDYQDEFEIELIAPNGRKVGTILQNNNVNKIYYGNTTILTYYGEPSPYSTTQEIYMDFIPENEYIDAGIWQIRINPVRIVSGNFDMWLPGSAVINNDTGFLQSNNNLTLTIPSTASKVITVGAYDAVNGKTAAFFGKGYISYINGKAIVKPDVVAPGVNIQVKSPYGATQTITGTSFATPIVTGIAALLMEWGDGVIIRLH